jgi:hypothetical protein
LRAEQQRVTVIVDRPRGELGEEALAQQWNTVHVPDAGRNVLENLIPDLQLAQDETGAFDRLTISEMVGFVPDVITLGNCAGSGKRQKHINGEQYIAGAGVYDEIQCNRTIDAHWHDVGSPGLLHQDRVTLIDSPLLDRRRGKIGNRAAVSRVVLDFSECAAITADNVEGYRYLSNALLFCKVRQAPGRRSDNSANAVLNNHICRYRRDRIDRAARRELSLELRAKCFVVCRVCRRLRALMREKLPIGNLSNYNNNKHKYGRGQCR